MDNRVCERSVSGAENGAERAENRVEWSGRGRKHGAEAERGAGGRRAGTERRNEGCRNRLERGTAFFAAHAPLTCPMDNRGMIWQRSDTSKINFKAIT